MKEKDRLYILFCLFVFIIHMHVVEFQILHFPLEFMSIKVIISSTNFCFLVISH